MLDQGFATLANRGDTAAVKTAGGLSQGDRSTGEKLAEVDRRRQTLIDSYAHWAKTRGTHQRQDQRFAGATRIFSEDPSKPETAAAALGKRGAANKGRGEGDIMGTPAIASRQGRRRNAGKGRELTAPERSSREGNSDRTLVQFLPGGSSRQLLLSRKLRRARLFTRGLDVYDHSAVLFHGVTPFRELQFLRGGRFPPNGHSVIHALPAETKALLCPAEVTEHALATVVPPTSPDAGMSVVAYTEPATAMSRRMPHSTLGAAQISMSTAPPQAEVAVIVSERPGCSDQGIEQCAQRSSLVINPSRRPTIVTVTNILVSEEPSAGVFIAGTSKAGNGENIQGQLLLASEQKRMPPLASVSSRSGFHGEKCRGLSCQNVVASTRSIAPDDRTAERDVCRLLPKTSQQSRTPPRYQQTNHVGSGESIHFAERDGENSMNAAKERFARIPPQHRSRNSTEEARDDAHDALIKADNPAITTEPFRPRPPHMDEVVTFLRNEGTARVRANRTTVQVVDISLPVGGHSETSGMEALGTQPQAGFDQYRNNGGSGPLLLCDARVRADDSNTSTPELCIQQRRNDRDTALALSGSHSPSRTHSVTRTDAGVDSFRVDGETKIVPHGTFTTKQSKEWRGEPHPILETQGKDDGQRLEPWGNRGDGIAPVGCQQGLGQVGAPPTDTRPFTPSRDVVWGGVVSPNDMVLFRAMEPVERPRLPENTYTTRGKSIALAQPVAENGSSSETVEASLRDEVGITDQHEDNAFVRLSEPGINPCPRDNQRQEGRGVLSTRDRNENSGKPCFPIRQVLPGVSREGTPPANSDLSKFSEGPEVQPEAPSKQAPGEDNCDKSTIFPPPCLLFVSPPCPPSPFRLATASESVVHETERNSGKRLTTVEPASAVPVGVIFPVDTVAGSVPADSSPTQQSLSSAGITAQPPSSSPLLHSPPALPLKQPSPPLFSIANANVDLSSGVELFSTNATNYGAKSDDNRCALSVPVVHRRPCEDQERGRRVLDAAGKAHVGHESMERRRMTTASK